MIYFVTDGEYVKIGFTDRDDVQQRIKALQIGNARELELMGTMQGGREEEMLLHQIFGGFRIRGEWFLLTPQTSTGIGGECNAKYLCAECERAFKTVQGLNAHQRFCTGGTPLNTPTAGQVMTMP